MENEKWKMKGLAFFNKKKSGTYSVIQGRLPQSAFGCQLPRRGSLDGSLHGSPKASLFEGGGPRSGSEGVRD